MIGAIPILQVPFSCHMYWLVALRYCPISRFFLRFEILNLLATHHHGVVSCALVSLRSQWPMLDIRCRHIRLLLEV
jgi:hypothetical protein